MPNLVASCPGCGAEVTFRTGGAIVVVCQYCSSVVSRTDRAVESLGKVAELTDTGSVLALGLKGRFRNHGFEMVGRTQIRHQAGGVWDEWYAHFEDGRWGWLAEAQGKFYVTFRLEGFAGALPTFDHAQPGTAVPSLPGFVVAERGTAHPESAAGEIPWRLVPGESSRYADLSGPAGDFATIDWGFEPPAVFAGWEVTLDDLGLGNAAVQEQAPKIVAAAKLNCPKCGGGLELRAPDVTERVTCPSCNSLLDASQGSLKFLSALKPGKLKPKIPLGATGGFEGRQLTVIGFMGRSVTYDGVPSSWTEYLLFEPHLGFRWLVESDGHWSYVKPVQAGQVKVHGLFANFHGEDFKPFQRAEARVDEVHGEFYWKVTVGEKVLAFDRICPPRMLSEERSADETNYSLGEYIPVPEIEKNFGVKDLPRPGKVGAIQPDPVGKEIFLYGGILAALAVLVSLVIWTTLPNRVVLDQNWPLEKQTATDGTQVIFSEPFTLEGARNLSINASSDLARNNWVYLDGDFYDETSGTAAPFALPIEYYYGREDGEYWEEGTLSPTVHLSALPAGSWTLRLEVSRGAWNQEGTLAVRVREGQVRPIHLLVLLGLLLAPPLFAALRRMAFETERWSEADFTSEGHERPAGGDEAGGDDD